MTGEEEALRMTVGYSEKTRAQRRQAIVAASMMSQAASGRVALPDACRRCENWCEYYGDPAHAAMCQSADDAQDQTMTEMAALRS